MARLFVNAGVRTGARFYAEPDWSALVRELKPPGRQFAGAVGGEVPGSPPRGAMPTAGSAQLQFREFERRLSPRRCASSTLPGRRDLSDYSGKRVPIVDPPHRRGEDGGDLRGSARRVEP